MIVAHANDQGEWVLPCGECAHSPPYPDVCLECTWANQLYACGIYPLKKLSQIRNSEILAESFDFSTWLDLIGVSQAKVAEMLGVSKAMVTMMKKGTKVCPPRIETLCKKLTKGYPGIKTPKS